MRVEKKPSELLLISSEHQVFNDSNVWEMKWVRSDSKLCSQCRSCLTGRLLSSPKTCSYNAVCCDYVIVHNHLGSLTCYLLDWLP